MFYQINFIAILYMSRAKNKRKQTNKKKTLFKVVLVVALPLKTIGV